MSLPDVIGAGPDALVMHPRTRRLLLNLLEAAGGPLFQYDETLGVPVLLFDGLPVYASQVVAVNEDTDGDPDPEGTLTSVYALKLHGPTGLRVLHAGGDSEDYGLIVEPVPDQPTLAVRGYTVRGYYAVMCPEIGSLARMMAIKISDFA